MRAPPPIGPSRPVKATRARSPCARCERDSPKPRATTPPPSTICASSCCAPRRTTKPRARSPPSSGSIPGARSPAKNDCGAPTSWSTRGAPTTRSPSSISPKKAPSAAEEDEIAWARAFALYKARSRYEKAALAYAKLGNKKGPRQAEALYYAARAASRADHDDEAAKGYRALGQRFPDEPLGRRSDLPRWRACRSCTPRGARPPRATAPTSASIALGKQRDGATYEHALALLADGKHAAARTELHALAASASGAEAARIRELEAIAARGAGDKSAAVAMWSDIVESQPFTWAAMAARARLAQEGEPPRSPDRPLRRQHRGAALAQASAGRLSSTIGSGSTPKPKPTCAPHEREAVAELRGREKEALCAMYGELGRGDPPVPHRPRSGTERALRRAPLGGHGMGVALRVPATLLRPRGRHRSAREAAQRAHLRRHATGEQLRSRTPSRGARAVGLLQLMPDTARRSPPKRASRSKRSGCGSRA